MLSRMSIPKSASLLITLCGGLIHSFLALQLVSSWPTLRSLEAEPESEYDNGWLPGKLRTLLSLLALYFIVAAFVSFVGFVGVLRNNAQHVRFYRDCSTADLLFTTFLGVVAARASVTSSTRTPYACDSPELAPLLPLIGALLAPFLPATLTPDEACERYITHLGAGAAVGLLVLSVVRVHFLLAIHAHYRFLLKSAAVHDEFDGASSGVQRIRLLPLPRGVSPNDVVYAPVHVPAAASAATDAEVWVRVPSSSTTPTYVESAPLEPDAGLLDVTVVRTKREWI
ncbi:hypothetical protein C8F01DRAFT_1126764 [Mycena amicta]|nr:hypothetical protein C8F01DRAFT_1126764 [Mycena amicta]